MKTESEIETLLRQAPVPASPPELGGKLKNAVRLPHSTNGATISLGGAFLRRWLPAIGYAVMVLGCVVVLAVQSQRASAVSQQLEKLREDIALKEQQLERQREQTRLALAADTRIRNLRESAAEAEQLAETLAELQTLIASRAAEAAELEAKLAAVPEKNEIIAPYDFFNDPDGPMKKAKEKAAAISCINNMKQIGLAIRIWETEHEDANGRGGSFPPNINVASRELGSLRVLCCPEDAASLALAGQLENLPDKGWSRWPVNGGSYDFFITPDVNSSKPTVTITRCRFHGHEGFADGSVQWGTKSKELLQ